MLDEKSFICEMLIASQITTLQEEHMEHIKTRAELRGAFNVTHEVAKRKVLWFLDGHPRSFIEKCPFLIIGSQDASGNRDASPKGELPRLC